MITLTDAAKGKLSEAPEGTVFWLPFDPSSCDISNTVSTIKGIKERQAESYEEKYEADGFTFITGENFSHFFDDELIIDYSNNSFVFKNKNQIFNNRVSLSLEN
ncbi:iron-sulfur cluster biosynthesis family protein [Metabacillus sp. GX 13764]|uniref:iron-sulfur cluster biosynthesis family protein n=1 Tax=Metabacillus kandeliae TaxID=2900151 RepID=UPI001E5129B4|nr:iron-sulfur cluster biosynthesis family protein [Metabacillus kandeliae]MCD7036015.1 iron-sulfur cluster biosynthesis family protein [Metabacillus kandeliae]